MPIGTSKGGFFGNEMEFLQEHKPVDPHDNNILDPYLTPDLEPNDEMDRPKPDTPPKEIPVMNDKGFRQSPDVDDRTGHVLTDKDIGDVLQFNAKHNFELSPVYSYKDLPHFNESTTLGDQLGAEALEKQESEKSPPDFKPRWKGQTAVQMSTEDKYKLIDGLVDRVIQMQNAMRSKNAELK